MGEVLTPLLGNQYSWVFLKYVHTVCTAWRTNRRKKRYVCSCRVTIFVIYTYGGIAHIAGVLQQMDKSSLGMTGQGGKEEWNEESQSQPGTESGK